MSVKVLSHVWQNTNQKGARLLVLLALADNADDGGWSWYSVAKIAKKSRQDVRATRNYLFDLHADGDILIYDRKQDDGTNSSNLYRVNFPGATEDMPEIIGDIYQRVKPEQRKVRGAAKKTRTRKNTSGGTGKKREGGTGKKREADPSVEPSTEPSLYSTVNEQCYRGSGDGYVLGTVAKWLGGGVGYVTANRKQNPVKAIPAQTPDDIATFAKWYKGKNITMPTSAVKFVGQYLEWMESKPAPRIPVYVAPSEPAAPSGVTPEQVRADRERFSQLTGEL